MKRIILVAIMVITMFTQAYAQFTIGPKAGLNISTICADDDANDYRKYKLGANIGVFGKYTINELFDIQSEIMYSQQGHKLEIDFLYEYDGNKYVEPEVKILTHNLNVPLLLRFNIPVFRRLYIEAGPQAGFFLRDNYSSKDKQFEEELNDSDIRFKTLDLQVIGGIGFDLGKNFSVNARYAHSLTSIYKDVDYKSRVFQFSLAYNLFQF